MKFQIDHDLHIHSHISLCAKDPAQTTERILQYAKQNGLSQICLTDHYWDNSIKIDWAWYEKQDFDWINQANPLPQADGTEFLFGCETEMDRFFKLGIPPSRYGDFAFIIVPTTHLNSVGFTISEEDASSHERRAKLWVERLDALLNTDMPFYKVGIAHLACGLFDPRSRQDFLTSLSLIPDGEMERVFTKAAYLGCGIELNKDDMSFPDEQGDIVLRPFRIAKACGCKFYLGSDAHNPAALDKAVSVFERAVKLLNLEEKDKFILQTK